MINGDFTAGMVDCAKGASSIWVDGTQEAEVKFDTKSGYGTSGGEWGHPSAFPSAILRVSLMMLSYSISR